MNWEETADRWFSNPEHRRLFLKYRRFPSRRLAEFDATATEEEKQRLVNTTQ